MPEDDILTEVWRNRDEFARQHDYDLDAMVATLKEMERRPLNAIVDRSRKAPTKAGERES